MEDLFARFPDDFEVRAFHAFAVLSVGYATPMDATLSPDARIAADWPAGKPIPPIPPGCREPVLEDNGVWNCDD